MMDNESVDFEVGAEPEPDEEDAKAVFAFDEKAPNLMPLFVDTEEGDEAIKAISDMVYTKFEDAWESSEEWREKAARDWAVFTGNLPIKDFPYKDSANVNIPMFMENTTRLLARLQDEIFPDDQMFFSANALADSDRAIAEMITKHDNWQFREKIRDFSRQQERALLSLLTVGDCTIHSFYDSAARVNRHETLTPDDFVIPYVFTTTQPDYSDVPYRFRILHYYRHELQAMKGEWHGVDKVLKRDGGDWDGEPETKLRDKVASVQGIVAPTGSKSAPYKLLHYEGWDDGELPNQERDRFIKVILDYETKRILHLSIHETENWEDKLRFERQTEELASYKAAKVEHAASVDQAHATLAQMSQTVEMARATGAQPPLPPEALAQADAAANAPPPPPPSWAKLPADPPEADVALAKAEPEAVRMEPIHMFAHGVCFENLVGALGLSYGRVQADLNRAANTTFNQFIDQATLGNCGTYIASTQLQFSRPFKIGPGVINYADGASAEEIKNGFIPLKPEQANPQMQQIVQSLYTWAQSSMQAPGVLSGEAGKSGETWRGIAARIEQATKQLSNIGKKYIRGPLRQVVQNNAKLNSLYLPDFEIVEITQRGKMMKLPISRTMWERNYQIEFRTDMRFATMSQKISEADEVVQMTTVPGPLQGDLAFLHEAYRRALEVRGSDELAALLGPPPPPPMTPFGLPPPPPLGPDGLPMQPPAGPPGSGAQPPTNGHANANNGAGNPQPGPPG